MEPNEVLHFDNALVVVLSLLVPVATAFIVKYRHGESRVHAIVALVLVGLVAVVNGFTDDVPNDTIESLFRTFMEVFIPALASYLGFWQPIARINAVAAPNVGIGPGAKGSAKGRAADDS